jgi:hypothetical protein
MKHRHVSTVVARLSRSIRTVSRLSLGAVIAIIATAIVMSLWPHAGHPMKARCRRNELGSHLGQPAGGAVLPGLRDGCVECPLISIHTAETM